MKEGNWQRVWGWIIEDYMENSKKEKKGRKICDRDLVLTYS